MKNIIYIATIFILNIHSVMSHNIPMASFQIFESDHQISIEIVFDLEDLANSLHIAKDKIDLREITKYLEQKTEFLFNNKSCSPILQTLENKGQHIKIIGFFNSIDEKIEKLEIWNSCLIENRRHFNLIQTAFNGISRDFKMDARRTNIEIVY